MRAGTGANGSPLFQPVWTVRTVFVRQQTFPPGRPVLVEHHYRTSIGICSDTVLRKALRESAGLRAELLKYQKQYCLGPSFLQSVDLMAGTGKANTNKVREQRIAYVLKTGANWAGPIKDFRLRVDPGGPNRLLSFCADGEKELVGGSVQVRAKDFTPHADLKILIVSKADATLRVPRVSPPVQSREQSLHK